MSLKKTKKPKGRKQSKNKKQSGGRVHMSGAYFGTPNHVYQCSPSAGLENHAYGAVKAVSYGVNNGDGTSGPNLHVFPNSSGQMTGGCGCSGAALGVGAVHMTGGANENPFSCVQSQPTQRAGSCGMNKGRSRSRSLKGGRHCHTGPTQRAGSCGMNKGRSRSLKGGMVCGSKRPKKGSNPKSKKNKKGGRSCGSHSQPTQRGGKSCGSHSQPTQRGGKK